MLAPRKDELTFPLPSPAQDRGMTPVRKAAEITLLLWKAEKLRQVACTVDDAERAQSLNNLADLHERDALELRVGKDAAIQVLRGVATRR